MSRLAAPRRRRLPAVRAALLLAALLAAPPLAAEKLSLAEAVELARAGNPRLAAARARAAAARAEAEVVARGTRWPRLGLSGGWTATDQPAAVFAQRLDAGVLVEQDLELDRLTSPSTRSHLGTALALELPVDAFGKTSPHRRAGIAAARAAEALAREAELETTLRVTAAWHRALVAEQAVGATERALAGGRAREADLEAQAAEGAALHADLLRVRTRRRWLEAELASRRGEHGTALAALALAIGIERAVEPAGAPAPPPAAGELAAWLAASEGAPGIAAAHAAVDAAAARADAEQRGGRPDLMLSALVRDDRGPYDEGEASGLAGAFLRWSLFDPQRAPRRQAAASARAAAEADLADALARTRFAVEAAWHGAAAAHERWVAARGGTEEGQEALRVVRERRAEGLATLTDELETEAASLAAELGELAASADAVVAHAELVRAAAPVAAVPEAP